ncbi:10150_t:CDS:2, partial [Cetraspora pellucida]
KSSFLETLEEDTVALMNKDIREEEKKMPNNIEQEIKSLFNEIISRDIDMTKKKLKQKECNDSFEINFALIEIIEDTNLLLEPISEGTYIVSVLAPILNKFFIKNKKSWRAQYGDTCLKASARDCNAQKEDDKHRSPGRKIDTIITLKEEDEEFSIVEVSGPLSKQDWTHFKEDRIKITKMLKTLMNRFAELRPSSNIRMVKLYAMQSYLYQLIIYEFRLKYSEVYTMVERLLNESSEAIQGFLWNDDDM